MRKTDISSKVRRIVLERDSVDGAPCCIYCGAPRGIQIAHFVSRGRGGKGVPENLACLCYRCHAALDNGSDIQKAKDIKAVFRDHLTRLYPGWNEEDLR